VFRPTAFQRSVRLTRVGPGTKNDVGQITDIRVALHIVGGMEYRRLGASGLKVSAMSLGSWITFGAQLDVGLAADCMAAAFEGGVNFFDTAEGYAGGESERVMGAALARLGWPRRDFVVSTKFFGGIHPGVNTQETLNRKFLLQAIEGSLDRLGLDFVDLVFCHNHDPETPIEETVWTMHDIVTRGHALYWGTSNWPAEAIRGAVQFAERHHLRKPVVEQPQYNLLHRERVEKFLAPVCSELGIGLTTWSPLSFGVLTGKYLNGIPETSRARVQGVEWLAVAAGNEASTRVAREVVQLSEQIGCTPAQLSIAWCLLNQDVSSVITGASSVAQVVENLGALDLSHVLNGDALARLEAVSAKSAS
jgi:voltage-dependent potassium channel beta subunit